MENEIQIFFLLQVQENWNELLKTGHRRPWGVWIREYRTAPRVCDGFHYSNVPKTAWFLDEKGFRRKDVAEFQRFIIFQSLRWRNVSSCGQFENTLWSGGGRVFHEIGFASFAEIQDADDTYYFEYNWGGRWGRGMKVDLGRGFSNAVWKDIWIS